MANENFTVWKIFEQICGFVFETKHTYMINRTQYPKSGWIITVVGIKQIQIN